MEMNLREARKETWRAGKRLFYVIGKRAVALPSNGLFLIRL
jgi:hypothetical protein